MVGAPAAHSLDFSKVTCGGFLASGRANIAVMFMFLHGYHAGKSGVIPFDPHDQYAGMLGFYCKQHREANLIESSERILSELDRGLWCQNDALTVIDIDAPGGSAVMACASGPSTLYARPVSNKSVQEASAVKVQAETRRGILAMNNRYGVGRGANCRIYCQHYRYLSK
jgi:hypothetical protein